MAPLVALLLGLLVLVGDASAAVPKDVAEKLSASEYVYVSSTRKDGSLSKPAEIWFLWHEGAVYVGTVPKSYRVKRIKAGRPDAKIAVGKVDGPSFEAKGELVKDEKIEKLLLDAFAKKYPANWKSYEERFRTGFQDGSRVVVRYTPK